MNVTSLGGSFKTNTLGIGYELGIRLYVSFVTVVSTGQPQSLHIMAEIFLMDNLYLTGQGHAMLILGTSCQK